jgi:hypothetical protein
LDEQLAWPGKTEEQRGKERPYFFLGLIVPFGRVQGKSATALLNIHHARHHDLVVEPISGRP